MVPYSATSLEDAEAICHVIKMSNNDLRKQQVGGFYRDIELENLYNENRAEEKRSELEGTRHQDITETTRSIL